MALPKDAIGRLAAAIIESAATPGVGGLQILNADGTPFSASISAGDIEIGSVELKDGTLDVRAKIIAGTSVVEADIALAVKDFANGFTTDAIVAGGAAGTISAKLRRLTSDIAALLALRTSATGTLSSVAGSASSVTLLASNANRHGATIFNDSSATLYIKCGATASATSFIQKLSQDESYEVPSGYTGIIDGIWTSATGNARVTEFT